jgi:hypothetical protein
MKQYTSRFLKAVALSYLAFPAVYLTAAALVFDVPAHHLLRILLAPFFWITSIAAIASGWGLWEMRRWVWYAFVVTHVLVLYGDAVVVNEFSASNHKALAFISSVFLQFFLIFRVSREVRVPYFFPKIRWWESNPRYRLSAPVKLVRSAEHGAAGIVAGEIQDISTGGCFVKLRTDLRQHESLVLDFAVFELALRCQGVVVWCTQSTVTHPRGVGIKFMSLTRADKRALRQITRRLRKIASFYRRSRYLMNQEDFLKKLQEMERPPQGSDKGAGRIGHA